MDHDSLMLFAVSVHEQFPVDQGERVQLLREVGERLRSRVPAGASCLWVFPAGYFGFNAYAAREGGGEAWPGFDSAPLRQMLPEALVSYPEHAWLCFGADAPLDGHPDAQQIWLCQAGPGGPSFVRVITRGCTPIPERTVQVGPVLAAFFDCGEFTGSHTRQNGPFCGNDYLTDPVKQLADSRLLVDLAHSRVSGTVGGAPGPRRVHEAQMIRFASHGAAVLTHHHGGHLTGGRPRSGSQSNWIVFRGGDWLDGSRVTPIP
jgi:hypothetical protein